jgi:hypothetical protein
LFLAPRGPSQLRGIGFRHAAGIWSFRTRRGFKLSPTNNRKKLPLGGEIKRAYRRLVTMSPFHHEKWRHGVHLRP